MSIAKPTAIIILGINGAGKSTQSKNLVSDYNALTGKTAYRLSSGDLIRQRAQEPEKPYYSEARETAKTGKLFPEAGIEHLISDIGPSLAEKDLVICDGPGRVQGQVELLNRYTTVEGALYLHLTRQEAKKRLLQRGRKDDTEEYIDSRHDEFFTYTIPVVQQLKRETSFYWFDATKNERLLSEEILAVTLDNFFEGTVGW